MRRKESGPAGEKEGLAVRERKGWQPKRGRKKEENEEEKKKKENDNEFSFIRKRNKSIENLIRSGKIPENFWKHSRA